MPRTRLRPAPVDGEAGGGGRGRSGGDEALRQRLLSYLVTEAGSAGEVVLPTKKIAEVLGANVSSVGYHMRALAGAGEITTSGAGPRGTRVQVGRAAGAGAGGRRGGTRGTRGRESAPTRFCPYCGGKVPHTDWRFCGYCGRDLP